MASKDGGTGKTTERTSSPKVQAMRDSVAKTQAELEERERARRSQGGKYANLPAVLYDRKPSGKSLSSSYAAPGAVVPGIFDVKAYLERIRRDISMELEKERLAAQSEIVKEYESNLAKAKLQYKEYEIQQQYQFMIKREQHLKEELEYQNKVGKKEDIMIVTTAKVPGYRITETCGAVMGVGIIESFDEEDGPEEEELLGPHIARSEAVEHMVRDAQRHRGNAIISFQFTMRPLDHERTKVFAQGTAVVVEKEGAQQCNECGTVKKQQKGAGKQQGNQGGGGDKGNADFSHDHASSSSQSNVPNTQKQKQKQAQQQAQQQKQKQKGKGQDATGSAAAGSSFASAGDEDGGPGPPSDSKAGQTKGQQQQQKQKQQQQQQSKKDKGKQKAGKAMHDMKQDNQSDDDQLHQSDTDDDVDVNTDGDSSDDENENAFSKNTYQNKNKKGQNGQQQQKQKQGGGKGNKGQKLNNTEMLIKVLLESQIKEDRRHAEVKAKEDFYKHMEPFFDKRKRDPSAMTTLDWLNKLEKEIEENKQKDKDKSKIGQSSSSVNKTLWNTGSSSSPSNKPIQGGWEEPDSKNDSTTATSGVSEWDDGTVQTEPIGRVPTVSSYAATSSNSPNRNNNSPAFGVHNSNTAQSDLSSAWDAAPANNEPTTGGWH